MKKYKIKLEISAECERDAEELIQDYSGTETDIEIKSIKEIKNYGKK